MAVTLSTRRTWSAKKCKRERGIVNGVCGITSYAGDGKEVPSEMDFTDRPWIRDIDGDAYKLCNDKD